MNKIKLILTVALTFVVLFAQAGHAAAAPLAETATDITGTVTGISFETNANNETIVVVTLLLDDQVTTQTIRISVATAASLGLLVLDENDQPIIDPATGFPAPVDVNELTEPITITADTIIPDTTTEEEPVHPIAALLAGFFGEEDENLASVIDGYHTDGFGFGVIAQALWMSRNLTGTEDTAGDASLADEILAAKEKHDYSFFADYFEDGTVPTNWGQFRKALLNEKENLGVVVSGQADESDTSTQSQPEHGKNNGNEHGKGNDNGKGKGHNKP